ncbi:MAG: hypothetical protein ACOX34_06115 [Bacillota bacterium]|jgi:hypothetical protein|nr:hypothetical protein [Candidatus Fermentithermobacillaceae bacterium]
MNSVIKAVRNCGSKLMDFPNVVGVGYGHKHVGGRNTGKDSLVVLVEKKVPVEELNSNQVIPRSMNQCPVDVIEVGEIVALGRTGRQRPARPGLSIGHHKVTAGTFGAVVYDVKTGEPLILSNNHVLANSSNGRDGRAKVGDAILQPGRYDGGTDDDVIAKLYRFVPIELEVSEPDCKIANAAQKLLNRVIRRVRRNYEVKFERFSTAANLVDAAVARPLSRNLITDDIIDLGVPRGTSEVMVGQRVKKSGRTSGTNEGEVKVVHATIKVSMGEIGSATFIDQVLTTNMAQPGDSGSVVVDEYNRVCGLLSAGSQTVSVFARIQNVCEALGVRF